MDKKDIYEHLANIYLDASSKRKKKNKHLDKLKPFLLVAITVIGTSGVYTLTNLNKDKFLDTETALILSLDAAKINFNFNPAKKENYSIELNKLNLSKFRTLGFSLKKAPSEGKINLRVEFTNRFAEKSEVYIRDIPTKWNNYKISFAEFKNINDWSEMANLYFSVETWNTSQDKGIIYLDNIRFLR